jgi:hypothetical protein
MPLPLNIAAFVISSQVFLCYTVLFIPKFSIKSAVLPLSYSWTAIFVMAVVDVASYQCFSSGGIISHRLDEFLKFVHPIVVLNHNLK